MVTLKNTDLEAAAEVERLHRKLGRLLVEVVLVDDVEVVRHDGDELLRLARNPDELRAEVESERVILWRVDQLDCSADNLQAKKWKLNDVG